MLLMNGRSVRPLVAALVLVFSCFCTPVTAALAQTSTGTTAPLPTQEIGNVAELTWTDLATGLMWEKKDNGSDVNWSQARAYCDNLQLAGHSGWRLPTIDELTAIDDRHPQNDGWSEHVKGGILISGWIWSNSQGESEAPLGDPSWMRWTFIFDWETPRSAPINFSNGARALCVRYSSLPATQNAANISFPDRALTTAQQVGARANAELAKLGTPETQGGQKPALSTSTAYSRTTETAVMPGRITSDYLKGIYKDIAEEKQRVRANLFTQTAPIANALLAILHNSYSLPNVAGDPIIRQIGQLQHRLGKSLQPRQPEDAIEINDLLRSALGRLGSIAPDSAFTVCCSALPAAVEQEKAQQDVLSEGEKRIAEAEQSLDSGDFAKANEDYQALSAFTSANQLAPLQRYLELSRALREDLAFYSKLSAARNSAPRSLDAAIHVVAGNEAELAAAADRPLTASYLQKWVVGDKVSLKVKLDSLPPFHSDVKPFINKRDLASSSVKQFCEQYDSASKDWEQLKRDLDAAHDLMEITSDQAAMQSIRSWYGTEFAESLMTKATSVASAKENEVMLMVYVSLATGARNREQAAIQQQHEQEEARKQALIDERNNLAGEIWNKVILITMLDEKFEMTEKMGYTMEADKQRSQMNALVRKDHAMLTPSLWSEVNAAYQRMLPGLTVWQASHARSIIAGLRSR